MARSTRFSGRLDTVVLAACIVLSLVASALPVQMRDPVASSLRRSLVAPLVSLQRSAEQWRAAWLESERRTLQRDSVAMQIAQARALTVENNQLRKLLGLGKRLQWGFIPAEALHTAGRTEDVITTLTLTAGSNAGVTRYSPVVSDEGIVGLVQTVDPRMSIAILYSHPDFRVCAMSADGSAFGIVYPHLDVTGARMSERYLLELRNVPFRSTLQPNTAIFSCGLGGAWPRGVLIGTVVDEVKESESWSRTYLIRPAVNPAHVTAVMILQPQRGAQGMGNIWADAAQAQSAIRTIVAAGDSVTREEAIAEANARRAAQRRLADSVPAAATEPAPVAAPAVDSATADSIARARRARAAARRADSIRRDSLARRDSSRPDTTPRRFQ